MTHKYTDAEIKDLLRDYVCYLAHPWANDPEKSARNAINYTRILREWYDVAVLSPILHTHFYWKALNDGTNEAYLQNENWLDWDIRLLAGIAPRRRLIIMHTDAFLDDGSVPPTEWHSQGCKREFDWAEAHGVPVLSLPHLLAGRIKTIGTIPFPPAAPAPPDDQILHIKIAGLRPVLEAEFTAAERDLPDDIKAAIVRTLAPLLPPLVQAVTPLLETLIDAAIRGTPEWRAWADKIR